MLAREKEAWCYCLMKPVICKSTSRAQIIRAFPAQHSQDTISLQKWNEIMLKINHTDWSKVMGMLEMFNQAGVNVKSEISLILIRQIMSNIISDFVYEILLLLMWSFLHKFLVKWPKTLICLVIWGKQFACQYLSVLCRNDDLGKVSWTATHCDSELDYWAKWIHLRRVIAENTVSI